MIRSFDAAAELRWWKALRTRERARVVPAPRDGTGLTIGVVSCSKSKLDRPAPARELYTSPMFRMSLAYALGCSDVVYIASALHGLVQLDTVIKPYDLKLSTLRKREREAWGLRVSDELLSRHGRGFKLIALAGNDYTQPLRRGLYQRAEIIEPLAGMQLGQRLAWLSEVQP